jgi:hypothetical protein
MIHSLILSRKSCPLDELAKTTSRSQSTSVLEMGCQAKVAFVSGGNGINGNAIIEHLIRTSSDDWLEQLLCRIEKYRRFQLRLRIIPSADEWVLFLSWHV